MHRPAFNLWNILTITLLMGLLEVCLHSLDARATEPEPQQAQEQLKEMLRVYDENMPNMADDPVLATQTLIRELQEKNMALEAEVAALKTALAACEDK